jgi:hypothetical protein
MSLLRSNYAFYRNTLPLMEEASLLTSLVGSFIVNEVVNNVNTQAAYC